MAERGGYMSIRFFAIILLFSGFVGEVRSQEIDDISKYVLDLESKLTCPFNAQSATNVHDVFGRKVEELIYSCIDDSPALLNASVLDDRHFLTLELIVSDYREKITEKSYIISDDGSLKSISKQVFKFVVNGVSERISSTQIDYIENATAENDKVVRKLSINKESTTEELWEYFANGVVSKYTTLTTTDTKIESNAKEYNETTQLIIETTTISDINTSFPNQKTITEYDPKTGVITRTNVHYYENGVERKRTEIIYKKGKTSERSYEITYNEDGIQQEKKAK